jgi:hypothetical protein
VAEPPKGKMEKQNLEGLALRGGRTTPKGQTDLSSFFFFFFFFLFCQGVVEPPHGRWFSHPRPAKGVAEPPTYVFIFSIFFSILLFFN